MAEKVTIGNAELWHGDCLELMQSIPDGSVDMILCDLPYGTTACKWDTVIPFEPLWAQYRRIAKRNAAIVLTASQPFTTALIASNMKMFRYCWVWQKEKGGNIGALRFQPSKVHEDIVVFSKNKNNYYPIMEVRPEKNKRKNKPRWNKCGIQGEKSFYIENSKGDSDYKYPTSVKFFNTERKGVHPTQKPVALMEYMIRTYTREGEVVLDNCMGSGTTGVACINTGRRFIGIEKDHRYFGIACERIENEQRQAGLAV